MDRGEEARTLMRSRAERHIARTAFSRQADDEPLPRGHDREYVDRYRQNEFEAALDVYLELGLITAEEADDWRRLAEAVATTTPPVRPRDSSARAQRLLEELLKEVEPVPAGAEPDSSALIAGPYGRLMGALTIASVIGELSTQDAETWNERLTDRVTGGRHRHESERTRYAFGDLRRVMPGPASRRSGLTVVSAELYADGCLLSILLPYEPDPDAELRPPELPELAAADDAGTAYVATQAGGRTGMPGLWAASVVVLPAPPPAARELTATIGDDDFVIDLSEPGANPAIR